MSQIQSNYEASTLHSISLQQRQKHLYLIFTKRLLYKELFEFHEGVLMATLASLGRSRKVKKDCDKLEVPPARNQPWPEFPRKSALTAWSNGKARWSE